MSASRPGGPVTARTSRFGVVGDIHGSFAALASVLSRHPEIPFWLCVGDVAADDGAYPEPPAPLYFIKGNNESFDVLGRLDAGTERVPNLHYIPNGAGVTIGPVRVAGLGGTHAPTWYDTPAAGLPARPKDDKRRHFVREEVEACRQLSDIDVLLTHEAPKPFWITLEARGSGKPLRRDVGKAPIAEVADALKPRLHCFGHHHVSAAFDRAGIPTVCVDRVDRSYLLVDAETLAWDLQPTGLPGLRKP